jgi:hypothetical protein
MTIYLPSVSFAAPTTAVVPAPTLNATASSPQETQLTVAASNATLRILYGLVRIGAQIANVVPYGNSWIVQAIWGEGPIDSIVSCQFNDEAIPAGVTVTHYLGEAAPTVNATLVAAFAANGQTYTDTLPSIAYSVFSIPAGDIGLPQINAVIRGRKVRNPGGSVAWSDNPALCLADFLESTTYGLGRTVADAGLSAARNACDALVSGIKRRTLGLAIDSVQGVSQWVDTLRTYAGCWVVMDESTALLIHDRPRSTDAAFLHDSGQISKLGNLKKRGVAQAPTVIEVRYTDTSLFPWREASVWAYAPGVGSTVSRRDSQVALPGIQSASQAQREANERLNKLWLADLSFSLDVFDEGARLQLGDVVEVTHPIGLDAKKMRVLGINGDYGRYSLNLSEYDPACYSDTVISDPTYSDTNLPSPANPPAVTGLTATEELFQLENGNYSSRIRMTWDAPAWPYLHDYVITIEQAGNAIDMRRQTATTYASAAVQEGLEYVCKVAVISSIGATGTVAQDNITPLGKYMLPNPVPADSLTAFEAGGTVYLSWGQATDIDIWRYRLKRGTTSQSYADATQIDLVDALRYQDRTTAVGTWRFWVDVVDSVQQESGTPRSVDVVVTSDASAFLVDSYDQTSPTLTNMAEYSLARTDANRYFVTEDGVAFGTKFSSNLSTYTDALATYHSSVTSTWDGEGVDFGSLLGGQWTGTATVLALTGSLTSYMGFSTSGGVGTYGYLAGLSQKTNARFARLKHESLTTSTLMVTIPTENIRLDAIPRTESGSGTSSAAGPVTITLENDYIATKKLTITPSGTTARSAIYDNIILGNPTTFDVYVFNDSGVKIASPFMYDWQGV